MPGKCTNCGKCCTHDGYMGSLQASGADVRRWRRQQRDDILQYVVVMGDEKNPWGDLWVDSETGHEFSVCPFVRREGNRWFCTIYATRPAVCRDYEPWAEGTVCEEVKD